MRRILNRLVAVLAAAAAGSALLYVGGLDLPAFARTAVDDYAVSESTGTIVPGTGDIGNHCNNCVTSIALPFPYTLYDLTFTGTGVSSNGNLQFPFGSNTSGSNTPLPAPGFSFTIFPYWDDLDTTLTPTYGVFTSVTGVAPNRVMNIEWRAREMNVVNSPTSNFEVQLFEGLKRFDVVYGATGTQGASATIGVQRDLSQTTQYSFNEAKATSGKRLIFTIGPTAATARDFAAAATPGRIVLRWRAEGVADVLGFNLWRRTGKGPFHRLNRSLIASRSGRPAATYRYTDARVRPRTTYVYALQLVRLAGPSVWAGYASARAIGR